MNRFSHSLEIYKSSHLNVQNEVIQVPIKCRHHSCHLKLAITMNMLHVGWKYGPESKGVTRVNKCDLS